MTCHQESTIFDVCCASSLERLSIGRPSQSRWKPQHGCTSTCYKARYYHAQVDDGQECSTSIPIRELVRWEDDATCTKIDSRNIPALSATYFGTFSVNHQPRQGDSASGDTNSPPPSMKRSMSTDLSSPTKHQKTIGSTHNKYKTTTDYIFRSLSFHVTPRLWYWCETGALLYDMWDGQEWVPSTGTGSAEPDIGATCYTRHRVPAKELLRNDTTGRLTWNATYKLADYKAWQAANEEKKWQPNLNCKLDQDWKKTATPLSYKEDWIIYPWTGYLRKSYELNLGQPTEPTGPPHTIAAGHNRFLPTALFWECCPDGWKLTRCPKTPTYPRLIRDIHGVYKPCCLDQCSLYPSLMVPSVPGEDLCNYQEVAELRMAMQKHPNRLGPTKPPDWWHFRQATFLYKVYHMLSSENRDFLLACVPTLTALEDMLAEERKDKRTCEMVRKYQQPIPNGKENGGYHRVFAYAGYNLAKLAMYWDATELLYVASPIVATYVIEDVKNKLIMQTFHATMAAQRPLYTRFKREYFFLGCRLPTTLLYLWSIPLFGKNTAFLWANGWFTIIAPCSTL